MNATVDHLSIGTGSVWLTHSLKPDGFFGSFLLLF